MSREFVALLNERPEIPEVLRRVQPPPGLAFSAQAGATQLYDGTGRMLVIVRDPVLVEVPDEAERLLGIRVNAPFWWVEVQAANQPEANDFAARCARTMADLCGGTVWNGSAS